MLEHVQVGFSFFNEGSLGDYEACVAIAGWRSLAALRRRRVYHRAVDYVCIASSTITR